jgi:hypothetical protein
MENPATRWTGWYMARFTGADDGPVYIDLLQVAAITDAKAPDIPLAIVLGSRVILYSGVALFTKESADVVFTEVHRARTAAPPAPSKIRLNGAPAPAPEGPALTLETITGDHSKGR